MPTNQKPSQLKRNRLLAAIPIDRVCKGCKRVWPIIPDDWRLTPYGDAVCIPCWRADKVSNPDIYGDPLLASEVWQKALSELRQERSRAAHRTQLDPHAICPGCSRRATSSDGSIANRQEWVYVQNADSWLCRPCYYSRAKGIKPKDYCEDTHGRVFLVTCSMKARYVFGEQKIPRHAVITLNASETVFELQREAMFNLVTKYLNQIESLAEKYSRRHRHIDNSDSYDICLSAAMRAATLYDAASVCEAGIFNVAPRPFMPYLIQAAYNAFVKELVRRTKLGIMHSFDELRGQSADIDKPAPEETPSEQQLELDIALSAYLVQCRLEIGEDDWDIFQAWVLCDKTQAELGRQRGVIAQTIGMRIKKIIARCQEIPLPL